MSADPFDVTVEKWTRQAKERMDDAYRATALLALARVQQLTPVRTGRLRAGWTISLTPQIAEGRTVQLRTILENLHAGEPFYIINPVIYARRINYGFVGTDSLGRHYNEKGRHMVEQTVQEMPQIASVATSWVMSGHNPYQIINSPVQF